MSIGTSPGETIGESIDEASDGSGGSDGFELPDWIKTPQAWLAGTLLTWLLTAWEKIIEFINDIWSEIAAIPDKAIYHPIATAFALPGETIKELWETLGTTAADVSGTAGPFAPIVVVGFWLIPSLLTVTVLYFLWGFVETYLPVEGIPVLRRLS